uniref:Polyprotein n=1 Tax=Macrostomum lignano TaxID=282301 RepID=A0A1I8H0P1_9PLAT
AVVSQVEASTDDSGDSGFDASPQLLSSCSYNRTTTEKSSMAILEEEEEEEEQEEQQEDRQLETNRNQPATETGRLTSVCHRWLAKLATPVRYAPRLTWVSAGAVLSLMLATAAESSFVDDPLSLKRPALEHQIGWSLRGVSKLSRQLDSLVQRVASIENGR